MTLFEYIEQHLENPQDERSAENLVKKIGALQKAASTGPRLEAEKEWYQNERYREGDHWVTFNRTAGRITTTGTKTKRVLRQVNLFRKSLRSLKNMILAQQMTWETAPTDASDEAKAEAKKGADVLTYAYDWMNVADKLYDVLDNAFMKYYGAWELVWDDETDFLRLTPLDSFDVYPDPTVREPRDGRFLRKTCKVDLASIKENQRYYEWVRGSVTADNRESSSEFKDALERQRSKNEGGDADETSTAILDEFYIRDQAQERVFLLTIGDEKLLRCDELKMKQSPIIFLFPERTNMRLYGATWMKDAIPINRTFENVFSLIEDYILKIKPKLMRPHGSSLKPITDELGDILEYKNVIADQLKEFMPGGLPATHFRVLDVCLSLLEDLIGVHAAASGKVPSGVKSGRGIEALQAGDDLNVSQPKSKLERFMEETGEVALELIAAHQVTEKKITDRKGGFSMRIMGENGLSEGQEPPADTFIVKPSKVNVSIVPAMGYTTEGKRQTARDLYDSKLIDRETALEAYNFSNVGDIVEKVEAEEARAKAMETQAKQPPVPVPMPVESPMPQDLPPL